MQRLREWTRRAWGTLRQRRTDEDIEAELRAHEAFAADAAGGASAPANGPGHRAVAMDAMREQRGVPWLEDTIRDVRDGLRSLARSPMFTTVFLVTLALGVGATAAVVHLLDVIELRPPAGRRPATARHRRGA